LQLFFSILICPPSARPHQRARWQRATPEDHRARR